MSKVEKIIKQLESFFGGLKFAVILILSFAIFMIVGTFLESYYGTEFANKVIYKSIPFMFLQFFLFLCIFLAALLRFPPKKHLYGFYLTHLGLLLILAGGFVTYYAGVDGTTTLEPNTPTRTITLLDDELLIHFSEQDKKVTFPLPTSAFPTTINKTWGDFITLLDYYPYSENKLQWPPFHGTQERPYASSEYQLKNKFVTQKFILSHGGPQSDFPSNTQMGPLTAIYLTADLFPCFQKKNPSKLIIWHQEAKTCTTIEEQNIKVQKTTRGNRFLVYFDPKKHIPYTFFPDVGPLPFDLKLKTLVDAPYRLFNKKIFEKRPHLFLFGESLAYFHDGKWKAHLLKEGSSHGLPWMNFQITLTKHATSNKPTYVPYDTIPIQQNGKLIKGTERAIQIGLFDPMSPEVKHKFWVTNNKPMTINLKNGPITFSLQKKTLTLPFSLSLIKFKMDKNPGTDNPASYESFVNIFDGQKNQTQHIYMNNPYKQHNLTFYQASYFKTQEDGPFGSILSVNYDPGRMVKYLGSLLLVLGSAWHFYLRRKKIPNKAQSGQQLAKGHS